jgi:hypothetical protein
MSISSVSTAGVAQAPDNSAKALPERDQRKLGTGTKAGAATAAAGTQDEQPAAPVSGSTVDMYL